MKKYHITENIVTKTIFIYDTIKVIDTVRFIDTIRHEVLFPKITKEDMKWSIDLYASGSYTDNSLSLSNPDRSDFIIKKQNTLSPSTSINYGANVNLNINNLILQTGINYTKLGERFKDEFSSFYVDSALNYEYSENGGYWYMQPSDTVYFDWLGHPIVEYDKTWVQLYDTTEVMVYDTSETITNYNEKNYYNYIELPLLIGYELYRNRSGFTVKTGIITGFLLNSSGKTISDETDYTIINNNKSTIPFVKLNYSMLISLGYHYRINNHFSVISESYYRKNLNSVFQPKYPVIQKFNSAGLKIGIRYHF